MVIQLPFILGSATAAGLLLYKCLKDKDNRRSTSCAGGGSSQAHVYDQESDFVQQTARSEQYYDSSGLCMPEEDVLQEDDEELQEDELEEEEYLDQADIIQEQGECESVYSEAQLPYPQYGQYLSAPIPNYLYSERMPNNAMQGRSQTMHNARSPAENYIEEWELKYRSPCPIRQPASQQSPQVQCPQAQQQSCPMSQQQAQYMGGRQASPLSPEQVQIMEARQRQQQFGAGQAQQQDFNQRSQQQGCPRLQQQGCPRLQQQGCPRLQQQGCPRMQQKVCPANLELPSAQNQQPARQRVQQQICPQIQQQASPQSQQQSSYQQPACPQQQQQTCPRNQCCPTDQQQACSRPQQQACPRLQQPACSRAQQQPCPRPQQKSCPGSQQQAGPQPQQQVCPGRQQQACPQRQQQTCPRSPQQSSPQTPSQGYPRTQQPAYGHPQEPISTSRHVYPIAGKRPQQPSVHARPIPSQSRFLAEQLSRAQQESEQLNRVHAQMQAQCEARAEELRQTASQANAPDTPRSRQECKPNAPPQTALVKSKKRIPEIVVTPDPSDVDMKQCADVLTRRDGTGLERKRGSKVARRYHIDTVECLRAIRVTRRNNQRVVHKINNCIHLLYALEDYIHYVQERAMGF